MPLFAYKARNELGKMVKGFETAEGEIQLTRILRDRNLYLIFASEKADQSAAPSRVRPKVKRRELIEFSSHMATILSAGIPILQGLGDLVEQRKIAPFGVILQAVQNDLEGGALIYEALARHPEAFNETYVNMIRAGETAGNVDKIFAELARFLEWQEEFTSTLKKISLYPAVVLGAISALIIFVFSFAFPRISSVLLQMKISLPFTTRFMIALSKAISSYWYLFAIGIAGGIMGLRMLPYHPRGRLLLDRLKLRIPLIGGLVRKLCLSRFAHHLSLLLQGGIGIVEALEAVEKVVGNLVIAEAVRQVREQVRGGWTLSEALQRSWVFPPLMLRMVSIGESTATLAEALAKVSHYYDQEVPTTVKKITSAAEPLLIVFLAAVVLTVALSIYLPIYRSISMIGK